MRLLRACDESLLRALFSLSVESFFDIKALRDTLQCCAR